MVLNCCCFLVIRLTMLRGLPQTYVNYSFTAPHSYYQRYRLRLRLRLIFVVCHSAFPPSFSPRYHHYRPNAAADKA